MSNRKPALYSITFGLSGCYMPDSVYPYEFYTRRELVAFIRDELERNEWPKSAIRQVSIRRVWSFIQRNGSSVAHFSIDHDGYTLGFHGLTQDEYEMAANKYA